MTAAHPEGTRCADVIAATMALQGIDRMFTVPGESFLALLDALADHPAIDVVTCRHEGGAALAAAADARLTRRPGCIAVSRGPGVANAMIGIHVAQQDALPLVVLIGQVERPNLGRGAFQEVDYSVLFAGIAKWVGQVDHPDRAAEVVARAVVASMSGTPGPAVVVLPEDVLAGFTHRPPLGPAAAPASTVSSASLQGLIERLASARRPLLVAGGQNRSAHLRSALQALSEHWTIPVAVTNKNQDLFDNRHPNFVGHLGYFANSQTTALLKQSDLVIALGTRLGEVASQGYTFPSLAPDTAGLVHVHPDPAVHGRLFACEQALAVDAGEFVSRLLALAPAMPPSRTGWMAAVAAHRIARQPPAPAPDMDSGVDFGAVVQAVNQLMDSDAVIAVDAGNFSTWVHRLLELKPSHEMVAASCGAMGMGVPGVLAAALRFPGRQVLAFCGDGGFMMTGNELATLCMRGTRPRIVIANNGSYGTIRTYQERQFPGRTAATSLANPDFAVLAGAFGAKGFRIRAAKEALPVLRDAFAHGGPAVIDVRCSLEYLMAGVRLSSIAAPA